MIKVCNSFGLDDLPLGTKGRVIALGLFDGIQRRTYFDCSDIQKSN